MRVPCLAHFHNARTTEGGGGRGAPAAAALAKRETKQVSRTGIVRDAGTVPDLSICFLVGRYVRVDFMGDFAAEVVYEALITHCHSYWQHNSCIYFGLLGYCIESPPLIYSCRLAKGFLPPGNS